MFGNIYLWIAGAFALTLLFAGCEHKRAEEWKSQYTVFVAQTEALGKEAEKKAKDKEAKDKETTKKATDDLQSKLASLRTDNERLRHDNATRRFVPAATNPSDTTDRACFSRTELDAALTEFAGSLAGLAEEGDQGIAKSEGWKKWWDGVSR